MCGLLLRSCRWAGALGTRLPAPIRGASGESAAKPVDLAYDVMNGRSTETPLVFLHGLFGSKSNFYSIAKALVQRTGRMVVTVDNRNHGGSGHSPVMTYEAMSLDLQNLLDTLQLPKCILIGHSMGGKVAMTTALLRPELIEKLVVVDVTPSQTISQIPFPKYITAMRAVTVDDDLSRSAARNQVEQQLQPYIEDIRTRQFILTNLVKRGGRYVWRVNLEAVANHMDYITTFPKFNIPYTAPTVFLGGGSSSYISSKDYPEIKRLFPNSVIQHVPGTGHWVHAEKPHDFINAICVFLGTS
ncbi:LOW QUALITY PROTEIN: sn-1-specific diacylglycerol lipase ABHD11 [Heterodontus francisci]|uniref:LOW QUALITY PROTEIN: sn-1-specific diacylglycerol lipase ABHD11 n=1 Tax=Heterodontus francisci TaxID=7792 RepID=UPI00355B68C1